MSDADVIVPSTRKSVESCQHRHGTARVASAEDARGDATTGHSGTAAALVSVKGIKRVAVPEDRI
jgi:hypothetical protein